MQPKMEKENDVPKIFFEIPLKAFDFDKISLTLPEQLKSKFIFYCNDGKIVASFCYELIS